MDCKKCQLVYETNRVVKIPDNFLAFIYYLIIFLLVLYIGGYGIIYSKQYQASSGINSVVVTKVKGVVNSNYTNAELNVNNPELYRRVFDSSDVIIQALGDNSGGFVVVTNIVITPNQTRSFCPESYEVANSSCTSNLDCRPINQILPLGNGPMTGNCVQSSSGWGTRVCEVFAWCPIDDSILPLRGKKPLLEDTQNFTVLVKNSIQFSGFGAYYKKRNILEDATTDYLQSCLYNEKTDPYCPTFRIGDIITGAGYNYNKVGLTGAIFALQINWFCSFDWGQGMDKCLPKYSFARLDNPVTNISPGFNFMTAVFHEEDRRTVTKNYGLSIVIKVEGEGRKFDSIRVVFAFGASAGLFAVAAFICDFLIQIFCKLKTCLKWKWLKFYEEEMKFDLKYLKKEDREKQSEELRLNERL